MEALAQLRSTSDGSATAAALLNIGKLHLALNEYNSSLSFLDLAVRFAQDVDDRQALSQAHDALSRIYEQRGDYALALRHQRLAASLRGELQSQQMQRTIAELQLQFNLKYAEQESQRLRERNEELEAENKRKKAELNAITLQAATQNEMLKSIQSELGKIAEQVNAKVKKKIEALDRSISDKVRSADSWEQFITRFEDIYPGFMSRLARHCPALTQTELEICALLHAGFATKEIADLRNIGVRAVEQHRYRIRKKLGLDGDNNLGGFLGGI
jgi:DNA-binding CsgD family transcriptional regulator